MVKATRRKNTEPRHLQKAAGNNIEHGLEMVASYLPAGSPQRAMAGIAGAIAGVLLAAAVIGVGPTALAGAAGYVVYHETHRA